MIPNEEQSIRIQILRGIAIIAVVMIHSCPDGNVQVQIWVRPFLNFCVGLFIFLSGMLSNVGRWRPWSRIKKVLIPYSIWTLVYAAFKYHADINTLLMKYLEMLLTGTGAAVMYYIFVYCELTLLIPFVGKLANSKYRILGLLISPVEILLMRTIPLASGVTFPPVIISIMHISCLGWFSYFYFGYLLGNNMIKVELGKKILLFLSGGGILLQILEGLITCYMLGSSHCGEQLRISCFMSTMILSSLAYRYVVSNDVIAKPRFLHILGNCSFGIYFSHLLIIAFLYSVPGYAVVAVFPLNGIIATSITCIIVLVAHRLFGKYAKYLAF